MSANTILLISSDTTDGSVAFTDSGGAHTITAYGDVHHSTDQAKFGATSIHFDGDADYLDANVGTDGYIGAADFTFDCWVYPTDFSTTTLGGANRSFFSSGNLSIFALLITTAGKLLWYRGSTLITTSNALTLNAWNHFAVERYSVTTRLYINGVSGGSLLNDSYDYSTALLTLGRSYSGYGWYAGYMDEIRFSDVARYSGADFIPDSPPPDPPDSPHGFVFINGVWREAESYIAIGGGFKLVSDVLSSINQAWKEL